MKNGFFRTACASPLVSVADTKANAARIIALMHRAVEAGADMLVLPELSVCGYTCGDLLHNATLLEGVDEALRAIAAADCPGLLTVVGAPVRIGSSLYNCAVVVGGGRILAVCPKYFLPNYNEFYEKRWFASALSLRPQTIDIASFKDVPAGGPILIRHKGVLVATEICEDLWTPVPPSCRLAMSGAEVIANLSASDDLTGKYGYLRSLVLQQSARCICAYAYASAGYGESTTDVVYDAKLFIAENGRMLAQNERWQRDSQMIVTDVDIEALRRDRMHNGSFGDASAAAQGDVRTVDCPDNRERADDSLLRKVDPRPFVPADGELLRSRCEEIISIQVGGLSRRLEAAHCKTLVVGVSGGLDSTLALLVACRAFDSLGRDRKGIIGVTMPGFGTTGRTYRNAMTLMRCLGVTIREVPISAAVMQHFSDIDHDPEVHDVTYENCQARERTQILMDIANQTGGMVLGTGDLSELALGWATYNGDHMSMYGVNVGVPKTLVKYLTRYFATATSNEAERAALLDIIDTPISPELIPAADDGTIKQKTEDLVGPYDLHDFFLYYTLRYGFTPERIALLARHAFAGEYDQETILKWEATFFRRFFAQQFKRSCLPDGPKVGSVCLSPRGDWRMPSDASSTLWQ